MATCTYAQIENDIPIIVKASLKDYTDIQREMFAEEYGKRRKTILTSYVVALIFAAHRWYITDNFGVTLVQWLLILCFGIGLIWVLADLLYIPSMVRERNTEIAKSVLTEQRILTGK